MIPCKLVHHTGTIIRFRTSQLPLLPDASVDIYLLLPTGAVAAGHFNRHQQNPNISGREVVRYIKRIVRYRKTKDVLVERRRDGLWVLHLIEQAVVVAGTAGPNVRIGRLQSADLDALFALADRETARGKRIESYERGKRSALAPSVSWPES
jgi:hypothetical protein